MNARTSTLGTLALTLLLAACGSQQAVPTTDVVSRGQTSAPLLGTSNPDAIPGQYIVVFSDGAAADLSSQSASGLISSLGLDPQGVQVQQVYGAALNGFAAKLSTQNLAKLQADKRVKYIEQDAKMHMSATQTGATWGLDRVDQRNLPLDGSYTYTSTASGVKVYIIDTGINTAHTNFGGRAIWGTNTTGDGNNSDCQGHGTHVAGTVGSATWGVAKGATLVAVKVLGCDGSGTNSGVIAGVNWAVTNKGTAAAVANMSLGGGASQAVDDAVNSAASKNLIMAVAAGNENQNACNVSPARAASAITVGSTTNTDARSSFSNYGSCVDLFAPGSNITSTWIGSTTATNTISGTSMATPHVAGAAALLIAAGNTTNSAVTSAMINNTTPNKVTGAGTGSPNRLLFTGSGTVTPPTGTTTYTGTVSAGTASYKPGTSGFSYAGGTLKATLSGPSGTDFDLYLQKYNGSTWADVAASESGTSSESINYAATSGTYRWEVYGYSGSGSYTLVETK
ncbi:S8 family peptidase [Deinococcus soli (ex Cha et al. 2016)]|uniref:Subtilisin family serine protease n=2 Tax=Deinococcus soli (ex Cha et al. 2016) TaxID=1309411 RepID=A0AAE4BQB0_9DEIO|nr:S8 family peptidase [Deinococcus soli (ex Cha et al. 2016)]MDR6220581.1 subtilisin family serine protease [Deinococcus soli (ex Cha et al. 2016)]MDR6330333.1 subtilisin family serine protease [Deinococcus soli (ex Cha et al. 2016)]MDR6753175.1 subtilisin family serine protease [Deinococcus soli (ex Cha et al. 2016)]